MLFMIIILNDKNGPSDRYKTTRMIQKGYETRMVTSIIANS